VDPATMVTPATVLLLTILFDLVDLWPAVGSFRFVWSWAYAVYFAFRYAVFLVAAQLLATSQPALPPPLVGFFAVLGGVAIVHGFGLKIADQELVNLGNLIETFKDKFRAQESRRAAEAQQAELLTLTQKLAQAPEPWLEQSYTRLLLQPSSGEQSMDIVQQRVDQMRKATSDPQLRREAYAARIVQENSEYARILLDSLAQDSGATGS
jgi:hypothetical protein